MKTLLTYTILNMSLVSPNKDTLVLKNDSLGHKIAEIWETNPSKTEKQPVIIFTKSLQNPFALQKPEQK